MVGGGNLSVCCLGWTGPGTRRREAFQNQREEESCRAWRWEALRTHGVLAQGLGKLKVRLLFIHHGGLFNLSEMLDTS